VVFFFCWGVFFALVCIYTVNHCKLKPSSHSLGTKPEQLSASWNRVV
jgi:hypothetical protein